MLAGIFLLWIGIGLFLAHDSFSLMFDQALAFVLGGLFPIVLVCVGIYLTAGIFDIPWYLKGTIVNLPLVVIYMVYTWEQGRQTQIEQAIPRSPTSQSAPPDGQVRVRVDCFECRTYLAVDEQDLRSSDWSGCNFFTDNATIRTFWHDTFLRCSSSDTSTGKHFVDSFRVLITNEDGEREVFINVDWHVVVNSRLCDTPAEHVTRLFESITRELFSTRSLSEWDPCFGVMEEGIRFVQPESERKRMEKLLTGAIRIRNPLDPFSWLVRQTER